MKSSTFFSIFKKSTDYKIPPIEKLRELSGQNDAAAQYQLGWCYENGLGVERNIQIAVRWYEKSAAQNNTDAQAILGECYLYGHGIQKDKNKAIEWLKKAALQKNHPAGQYAVGFCYSNRIGGMYMYKDEETGAKYYRQAAKQNYARAQNALGYYYSAERRRRR